MFVEGDKGTFIYVFYVNVLFTIFPLVNRKNQLDKPVGSAAGFAFLPFPGGGGWYTFSYIGGKNSSFIQNNKAVKKKAVKNRDEPFSSSFQL